MAAFGFKVFKKVLKEDESLFATILDELQVGMIVQGF
jgi:hypothetical protein